MIDVHLQKRLRLCSLFRIPLSTIPWSPVAWHTPVLCYSKTTSNPLNGDFENNVPVMCHPHLGISPWHQGLKAFLWWSQTIRAYPISTSPLRNRAAENCHGVCSTLWDQPESMKWRYLKAVLHDLTSSSKCVSCLFLLQFLIIPSFCHDWIYGPCPEPEPVHQADMGEEVWRSHHHNIYDKI